jgi:tetratricopeptide (TPR) repeat protein
VIAILMALLLAPLALWAQDQQPPPPSQQQPAPEKPAPQTPDKPHLKTPAESQPPAKPSTQQAAKDNYDPFHAEQDMEVGTFYMHKGDVDAAIERFKDAIRLKPNFAKPRLLLADIYAKKGDKEHAVRYYKEFLQIMPPGSPDTKRAQKQIEKLSQK